MHSKKRFAFSLVAVAATLGFVFVTSFVGETTASKKSSKILNYRIHGNEPLTILQARVKGMPMELSKAVSARDNWLDNLELQIQNTSNQPISFFEIYLELPGVTSGD